jgi:hypothetical protein
MSHTTSTGHKLRVLAWKDEVEVAASRTSGDDLTLELGLSVWMHRHAIADDDCLSAMLAIRAALVEASGMDAQTEPIPLYGRSPEADLAIFAGYLADLFIRASAVLECELPHVIGRVGELLAS